MKIRKGKLFVTNQLKITSPFIIGWPPYSSVVFWQQNGESWRTERTLHHLFRTSKEKVINIYFNSSSTINDNERKLTLHDKNYKEKILNQLNIFKRFRREEESSNLTRNHLICNIFCILEKDAKTKLLEKSLLVKEKEQNKLEFCVFKKNDEKTWMADFVSDRPSGLSSSRARKEEYLQISEKDLNCKERKQLNHNHAESITLYVLEQNKHLFIELAEEYKESTIKAFGVKFFSFIDSCQPCNEEIHNFLKKVRNPLHELVKKKLFLPGYQNQKRVPFYTLFYSWRPYNSTEYTITNSSNQQKNVCKILSNNGKKYSFENYPVIPDQNLLKKEELTAGFKTIYSHIATFEQSEQEKRLEELEEACSNIIKKANNLDRDMKEMLKTVKEAEQMFEQFKKMINEELEIANQKETKLENKIETPPKK